MPGAGEPRPQVAGDVRAAVAARVPLDERERRSIDAFLAHFDALSSPFDEDADPVHVTASAIVIGARGVVLHKHKRLGLWLQPGGHIDAGELPWDAAVREAQEETGLAIEHADQRLAHVDVHPGPRGHTHLDLRYVITAADADPAPPPGESQEVRWFGWDEAIAIADDGLRGALVALRGEAR
ncbi:MAG TPA: NUDIX domain-containing protein [Ilumatobacteraceae bacterium]|nr:NUDIX domain-containing protein [Ilumatobacteraceae bacterium]